MESRISNLTVAVDSGDFRQAIRTANQMLLWSQKQLHCDPEEQLHYDLLVKSIKVIILTRQGKTGEALDLLRQLPRDDPELNEFLCIAHKELRNTTRLSPCRTAALPNLTLAEAREEAQLLEMCSSLEIDCNHALRLYKSYRRPRYLLWAIVWALMPSRHPSAHRQLQLAQLLLQQLPPPDPPKVSPQTMQDPKVNTQLKDSNAALIVHISVLRQCNRADEALELLKKYSNCCILPGELQAMKIQLLTESGKLKDALSEAANAVDRPEISSEFIGAFIRLAAANGKEATEKALKKLRSFNSFQGATAALDLLVQRGLEILQGHDRLLSERGLEALWMAVECHGDPVEELHNFFKNYSSHFCAFRFFRAYASRLTELQRLKARDFLLQLRPAALAAASKPEAAAGDVRSLLTIDKSLLALGEWRDITDSSEQRLREWRQLFMQHSGRQRIDSLLAELIGVSVEVLLRWDKSMVDAQVDNSSQDESTWVRRRFLFEALSYVDAGLSMEELRTSPLLHQTRVALSYVIGDLYSIHASFAAMDVKESLLLSLGLYLTCTHFDYGCLAHMSKMCKLWKETQEEMSNTYADYISATIEEGSFSWIPEFRLWGLITEHSLEGTLSSLQEAFFHMYEQSEVILFWNLSSSLHSQPLAPLLQSGCLRAAALCRGPVEWWLTAAGLSHADRGLQGGLLKKAPAGVSFGALAPLTCSDLGLTSVSLVTHEEAYARELAHPIRRALQLHKSRQALKAQLQRKDGATSSPKDTSSPTLQEGAPQESSSPAAPAEPTQDALMSAAFNEEERALFAVWLSGLHPKIWRSAWPSRLLGAEASHALSRHEFVSGPPSPESPLPTGAVEEASASWEASGSLYRPGLSQAEVNVLQSVAGVVRALPKEVPRCPEAPEAGNSLRMTNGVAPVSRAAEASVTSAESSNNPQAICCFSRTCAACRPANATAASACGTDAQSMEADGVLGGTEGALKEAVGSLIRSIPGRTRRLRLILTVMQPSAEFQDDRLRAAEDLIAELQQVTDECFTSCCDAVLARIRELKGIDGPALTTEVKGLRLPVFDAMFGLSQVASVSLALFLSVLQQLVLWHRALSRTLGTSSTAFSVLLKDVQPSVAAFLEHIKEKRESLVDATEVATQLEAKGQLPWMASATDLPYAAADDSLMEKARERLRMRLCSSYIEQAVVLCSVLRYRIAAFTMWLDQGSAESGWNP
ncbi:hypothetical protein, conserved [Eimeria necatrix]|uniref:N-acetyltransferase B complex (NatB) non catalytic subunit n=1 Tax=Eimeria necatrix TaxID=51315 RepID=U6MDI7_9EIME|nr:hypothetical protein, conserved [Eimeria necatrix]CDJ62312.1 hypothetical protein, conserved [Eimeria necatrix]